MVRKNLYELTKNGPVDVLGSIGNIKCFGKISRERGRLYFLQNCKDGDAARNFHGFMYSWVFDQDINTFLCNNNVAILSLGSTFNKNLIVSIVGENGEYVVHKTNNDKGTVELFKYETPEDLADNLFELMT